MQLPDRGCTPGSDGSRSVSFSLSLLGFGKYNPFNKLNQVTERYYNTTTYII